MLSKGIRDEDNERVSRMITSLLSIGFVPDLWNIKQKSQVDETLKELIDLDFMELIKTSAEDFSAKIKSKNLKEDHLEGLGDILLKISDSQPENQQVLAKKALLLYELAQVRSRTFSVSLNQKIEETKDLI